MYNTFYSYLFPFIFIILLIIFLISCNNDSKEKLENNTKKDVGLIIPEPTIAYEFVLDSFIVDTGKIKQNEGLAHILPFYGITTSELYQIVSKYDSLFDVKKIKTGQNYMVLSKMQDTIKRASHFIYEINAIDYLVYSFEDSLYAYIGAKDVVIKQESDGGVITSSLWNAFMDHGLTPALLIEFTQLYAWSVDFFDVKKGDYYKVIYDAKYVDDKFVGIGKIHATLFYHKAEGFYFFGYETDSIPFTFFTDSGEQMQRALLSAPLEYTRVSSKFSNNRFHPVLKIYRPHHGVDYAAPIGTEVVATGSGVVTFASYSGGAGNMVKIKHDIGDIETKYLHLSKYGPGIKKGEHVLQGQKIGEVGSTGTSTGPHLDYRVYINGKAVDPLSIDIPTVDPLKDSALIHFLKFIEPIKFSLDQINPLEVDENEMIKNAATTPIQ
jgi:murein DD-endopeptidase MepM/ murein hydrolase activator NlpD